MNGNKNDGQENTENPYQLLKASQRDILTIKSILKDEDVKLEDNVETVCRSASESVEKMVKAFIIKKDKNIKVFGKHDLEELHKIACTIDKQFEKIEDNVNFLNNYTTALRYNSPFTIEKHEVKRCLKALKKVYDFPLIKEVRDIINKQENFIILPENINTLFGKYNDDTGDYFTPDNT